MAKRQTRRSVSMKGLTYQRVRKYCDAHGVSISKFVEDLINERLDALGVPQETVLDSTPVKPRTVGEFKGSIFTF